MGEPAAARLTIDLDALAHNHAMLRRAAPRAEVAPVLKADGYGLGAGPVGRRLWAEGARRFFVARLDEGEALRAALTPERPATIYVLDGFGSGSAQRLAAAGLTPVINSLHQAAIVPPGVSVGLHVDTGMNRQGLSPAEARGVQGLEVGLIMSHLGSAANPCSDRNNRQLQAFLEVRSQFPGALASLAASAGIFLSPDYHFDMVRPGVSLFGGGPLETPDPRLKAVATLTAPIVDIRELRAGDVLGYGDSIRMAALTRVAVVAAGYADGVIRAARAGGHVWVAGRLRPLLVVTMDLLAVDLGDAPAAIGDEVELLGTHALLDDLAATAGTVAHEILVRLSTRARRVYRGG